MRQGQQNRRGRGRHNNNNNNNRKGQNPLARSFESNGPDVKIRGTPAHIAEKYLSLARDAQASGDPVLAENYLQHAEHYTRIIMAYREQQMGGDVNGMPRPRPPFGEGGDGVEDFGEDDGDDFGNDFGQPTVRGHEQQPRMYDPAGQQPQQQPAGYGRFDENGNPLPPRPPRHERHGGEGGFRQPREGRGDFRGRDNREPREYREPREPREQREPREPREPREFRDQPRERVMPEANGQPHPAPMPVDAPVAADPAPPRAEGARGEARRGRDRFGQGYEQPEFLRRPVRRPRREQPASDTGDETSAAPDEPTPEKPQV